MAASGLNQAARDKNDTPKDHLYALMDFCIEVLDTVARFNEGKSCIEASSFVIRLLSLGCLGANSWRDLV